jgi:hypothetical protein
MNRKVFTIVTITALFLLMTGACEKNSLPDGRFIGTWIAADKSDTLYFIDDHTFQQPAFDRVLHSYAYSYTEDSIKIQYAGPNFVLVRPSMHHYTLTRSTLTIDFSKVNYGFEQVKREYIRK